MLTTPPLQISWWMRLRPDRGGKGLPNGRRTRGPRFAGLLQATLASRDEEGEAGGWVGRCPRLSPAVLVGDPSALAALSYTYLSVC